MNEMSAVDVVLSAGTRRVVLFLNIFLDFLPCPVCYYGDYGANEQYYRCGNKHISQTQCQLIAEWLMVYQHLIGAAERKRQ